MLNEKPGGEQNRVRISLARRLDILVAEFASVYQMKPEEVYGLMREILEKRIEA